MSVELVALVVSTLTMLLGFVTVVGWLVTRTDRQFEKLRDDLGGRIDGVERGLGARIDGVESALGARIDGVERALGARIDGVEREIVEVKIAVARIEGPPRQFLAAR